MEVSSTVTITDTYTHKCRVHGNLGGWQHPGDVISFSRKDGTWVSFCRYCLLDKLTSIVEPLGDEVQGIIQKAE